MKKQANKPEIKEVTTEPTTESTALTPISEQDIAALERMALEANRPWFPIGTTGLKFNGLEGFWHTKDENDLLGAEMIVDWSGCWHGWTKVVREKAADYQIVRFAQPAPTDPNESDPDVVKDKNAKPLWGFAVYMPMKSLDGTRYTYLASGSTAPKVIRRLTGYCAYEWRTNPASRDRLPVIELGSERYKSGHGNWCYAPILKVVGWQLINGSSEPKPAPRLAKPAEEVPAAKPTTKRARISIGEFDNESSL
jgi:hypothetical protein